MTKHNQMRLLRQCAGLFAKKHACNESSIVEWLKIVFAAHRLGYLYCGFEGEDIDIACIAYRTDDFKSLKDRLPENEDGFTLYVCAVASRSSNRFKLLRLLNWYLKNNMVMRIAFAHRNSDMLRIYQARRKYSGKVIKA